MTRFLRFFSAFRSIEERADNLDRALHQEISARLAVDHELESVRSQFQIEQARRISAEAIAGERGAEIDRLLVSNRELRDDLVRVTSERIKSVDSINMKLMEAKIPEQPIDFKQHHAEHPVVSLRRNIVNDVRASHRAVDMAILKEAQKGFPNRRIPMNGTIKVPTLAEIEATDISTPAEATA